MASSEARAVVAFWRDAGPEKWFAKDDALDALIARRFGDLVDRASAGGLHEWENDAEDALALLILLDQFPRNLFRGSARAFATDARAREVAARAIAAGFDAQTDKTMRAFFYLPFMHSENLADQDRCVDLYRAMNDENGEKYAIIHRDIIEKFGRFPHRNAALGRTTTPDEADFLKGDGFKG